MTGQYCKACEKTKSPDEFYVGHSSRCKSCIRSDSKRTYDRNRDKLRQAYAASKDERRADGRQNYEANKERILLQSRLRYRKSKTVRTIEDEAVIDELTQVLAGTKPEPESCGWCGDGRYRLDLFLTGDTDKVSWLCPRCSREVKAERRTKTKRRQRSKKRPKPPSWLRRLLGR